MRIGILGKDDRLRIGRRRGGEEGIEDWKMRKKEEEREGREGLGEKEGGEEE